MSRPSLWHRVRCRWHMILRRIDRATAEDLIDGLGAGDHAILSYLGARRRRRRAVKGARGSSTPAHRGG